MAQRLATEYVKTCLELTEAEMSRFISMFQEHQNLLQVKVMDNGSQEIVLMNHQDERVALSFERRRGKYVFEGSCRLTNPQLVNLMRKAVSEFKGSAIVNRVYTGYTMVYHYVQGSVVTIIERKGDQDKIIYAHQDTLGEMEKLFLRSEIEQEIEQLKGSINQLLDLRNEMNDKSSVIQIDGRLTELTHRLFVLEAY